MISCFRAYSGDPDIDAQWKKIQEKTFTRWVNEQLKVQKVAVKNLATDFSDGVLLIVLLEVLSQKTIGRYNKKPRVHAQKMENLEKVLKFIQSEGIKLVNIGESCCLCAFKVHMPHTGVQEHNEIIVKMIQ